MARGSTALEGAGTLAAGGAARLAATGSPRLAVNPTDGAEVLIWESAAARLVACTRSRSRAGRLRHQHVSEVHGGLRAGRSDRVAGRLGPALSGVSPRPGPERRALHAPGGRGGPPASHTEDEAYCVVAGRGRIRVADEDRPVVPESLVYVPAHVEHRFHAMRKSSAFWCCLPRPRVAPRPTGWCAAGWCPGAG